MFCGGNRADDGPARRDPFALAVHRVEHQTSLRRGLMLLREVPLGHGQSGLQGSDVGLGGGDLLAAGAELRRLEVCFELGHLLAILVVRRSGRGRGPAGCSRRNGQAPPGGRVPFPRGPERLSPVQAAPRSTRFPWGVCLSWHPPGSPGLIQTRLGFLFRRFLRRACPVSKSGSPAATCAPRCTDSIWSEPASGEAT